MPAKSSYRSKLKKIKVLLLDVDGVMTDGGVYYSDTGEELKKFNIQDGYGIVKAQRLGITIGIITGRVSSIVQRRANELGIKDVHQNLHDKLSAFEKVKAKHGVTDEEVAYVGDDEPDLPVMERVGFAATPADGVDSIKRTVDYVCKRAGGKGAVREVIELILSARGGKT